MLLDYCTAGPISEQCEVTHTWVEERQQSVGVLNYVRSQAPPKIIFKPQGGRTVSSPVSKYNSSLCLNCSVNKDHFKKSVFFLVSSS